ncbi:RNase P subunit p29-like protein [Hymenopellis radicata]|nr:RNase P subunit p29-like protein [Hymenopellis radicata]
MTLASDAAEIYATRVHGRKVVLENPVKESQSKKEKKERKARHKALQEKKRKGISKRDNGKAVWRLDERQAQFALFLPLHHLWMGYMSELLNLPNKPTRPPLQSDMPSSAAMHPKLLKADFHGSVITVRQSKNPSLLGISGIVIHETENTFNIITKANTVKLIPKANSIFTFAVPLYSTLPPTHTEAMPFPVPSAQESQGTVLDRPHIQFELYGNQFCFRSADRAGRKFKHKETIEL